MGQSSYKTKTVFYRKNVKYKLLINGRSVLHGVFNAFFTESKILNDTTRSLKEVCSNAVLFPSKLGHRMGKGVQ